MADKRAYFKLDVGYLTNPKVASVAIESSDAVLLHIASIAYSAQHLTDGEVPLRLLLRLTGASQEDADLLLSSGLWETAEKTGHVLIHDYLAHQRSSTEAKGASAAAKRAAEARWDADRSAEGNASGMRNGMRAASESAMPREREEREREEDVSEAADATPDAPKRLDVERLCNRLADRIEANGSKRPEINKGWRDAARLMLDRDKRTEDQVARCIDWCQSDEFWRGNVLSMPKLREKYDQMRLQAERKGSGFAGSGRPAADPDAWMRPGWGLS